MSVDLERARTWLAEHPQDEPSDAVLDAATGVILQRPVLQGEVDDFLQEAAVS